MGRHVGVHMLLNIVPSVRKGRVLRCSGPTMRADAATSPLDHGASVRFEGDRMLRAPPTPLL